MRRRLSLFSSVWLIILTAGAARAEDIPAKYREVIRKGLEYIAGQQMRDGHWEGNGGAYPTTITALCGMTLLMEGSTMREGKYAERIRKTVDWLMDRSQRN